MYRIPRQPFQPEAQRPALNVPEIRSLPLTRWGPRHIPVLGPTQALRGQSASPCAPSSRRAAPVPRGRTPAPRDGAHGPLTRERQSSWQLAQQVWQNSGIDWERPSAPPAPDPRTADSYASHPTAQESHPAEFLTDDPHADPPSPDEAFAGESRPSESPASEPDASESRAGHSPTEDSDPDEPYADEPNPGESYEGEAEPVAVKQEREKHGESEDREDPGTPREPEVWDPAAHSPGRSVAPGPADPGPAPQAPPPPRRIRWAGEASNWYPSDGFPGGSGPADRAAAAQRPYAFATPPAFAAPRALGSPPSFASPRLSPPLSAPLSAPVAADASPLGEPGELFRAWQGSVREAASRRSSWPARWPAGGAARRRAWQAAKIGVPTAVIVTVGAGALMMLTGRANDMLAERSSTGPLSSGAGPAASHPATGTSVILSGYPGEHGTAAVAAMWSSGSTALAVGYADGHPAVWRRASDGSWALVSAAVLGGLPGHLTSVAQGPSGWIAVGSATEDGSAEPVVFGSDDGVTWQPMTALTALAGSDAQFLGVAAGPGGYLVVGRQGTGAHAFAQLWWSGDLRSWVAEGSSGYTNSFAAAAVAVGNGFVAVGSQADCHTVWTSPDGRHWTVHDIARPAGAQTATLRSVAATSVGRVVAAGYATNSAGAIPIVVTTADGGAQLTQVVLSAEGTPATVTGVTATAAGFVAVGLAGPANDQHAVTWTSADGLAWSTATPLRSAGTSEITALTGQGTTVTGIAQHGATPALVTVPAP